MDRDSEHTVTEALAPIGSVAGRALRVILFGVMTGGLACLATVGFAAAYQALNDLLLISPESRAATDSLALLVMATIAVPTVGGLAVGLCNRYFIDGERAHGPAHVIRAAQSGDGRIGIRGGLASATAAILSLGSGASVGQYGPLVHLGSTLGSALGRWTRGGSGLGTIGIGCGVAAAIATAFNAPIAGVLFAHEVVLRHYSLKAFAPITVAATLAYFLAEKAFLQTPLFRIGEVPEPGVTDLVLIIGVGIGGALLAVAFMKSVLYSGQLAGRAPVPDFARPAMAGLLLGIVALGIPEALGMGFETLRTALDPLGFAPMHIAMILAAKVVVTALCLGFGFAGGITGPALVIGTLFGALVGHGVGGVVVGDPAGITLYAIVGMAAVTSPVMGAPISTVLIVFEMTRNYDLTTAVLITVVFSNLVAYRLFGRSMFDVQLRRAGFDLRYGRDKVVLDETSIGPWVVDDYLRLPPETSCREARAVIVDADAEEAQVISGDEYYLGVIDLSRLDAAVDAGQGEEAIAARVVRPAVVLDTTTSIWQALARVRGFNGHAVPVVGAGRSQRLAGVVPEPVLIRAYLDTIGRIRDEDHATP